MASGLPVRTLHFGDEKPVLAMPADAALSHMQCAADELTFFELNDATAKLLRTDTLYSVSAEGEMKRIERKLPADAASVSVLDFFAADHSIVTLLEADGQTGDDKAAAVHDVRYMLSLSEHDGDGSTLLPLDIRFKPYKVASFGSGDFIVAGWDESNLLPVLAVLKEDGTVRRFLESDNKRSTRDRDGQTIVGDPGRTKLTAELLRRAVFVPFGNFVLLTFPGAREALQVWSTTGEEWTLPLGFPADTVLHDVLASGERGTLIVRSQPAPPANALGTASVDAAPPLRLFELNTYRGGLLREFESDKPSINDVVCGAKGHMTAMFLDNLPDSSRSSATVATEQPSTQNKHWVVATSLR